MTPPSSFALGSVLLGLCLAMFAYPLPSSAQDSPPKIDRIQPAPVVAHTSVTPSEHTALLEELRLAIHAKQTARARSLLQKFPTAPTTLYQDARQHLMRALVALQEGDGARALQSLKALEDDAFAPTIAPIAPYLDLLKARATNAAGNPIQAAELFGKHLESHPASFPAHYAHAERADALYHAGQFQRAADAYKDLLARYPEYPRAHRALYRRAQSLLAANQTRQGARVLQDVWLRFPWKHEGTQARLTLDALGLVMKLPPEPTYDELFERARTLRMTKHWASAEDAFASLLASAKTPKGTSERENSVRLQQALLAYDQQYYDRALTLLNALDKASQSPKTGAGLNRNMIRKFLQRCHYRMGNAAQAEQILKERLRGKSSKDQHEDLYTFYMSVARYPEALRSFDKAFGSKEKRSFRYAFLNYKAGNYKKALSLFESFLSSSRASKAARYRYWMGRIHQARGSDEEARALWQRVKRDDPFSYYAYQAANRLWEMDEAKRVAKEHPPQPIAAKSDTEISVAHMEPSPHQARVYWAGPNNTPAPKVMSPQEFQSLSPTELLRPYATSESLVGAVHTAAEAYHTFWPELRTAALLHDVGMSYEARYELRDASLEFYELMKRRRDGDDVEDSKPLALKNRRWAHHVDHRRTEIRGFWGIKLKQRRYPIPRSSSGKTKVARRQRKIIASYTAIQPILKRAMMEVGDFHLTRRLRQHEGGWDRTSTQGANRAIWSELHPRAFAPILQRYASKEGLNPMMLWALMTVESAYNPDSVSYADARGLLQVIPKTGNRVAADIQDNDFGPYDLLDPETSLRHGAWYFARLLRKFHGQEPLAIASYNGGPHNVQQWLLHKHHLPLDEFVEEIPFRQARGYTKKVLRFIALYRSIYEGNYGLYVGQKLRSDRLDDPRY